MMLHCRAEGDDRFVEGIVVPWDQEVTLRGRAESFAPGSVRERADGAVPLRWEHTRGQQVPIGVMERAVDADEGLWGSFRLFDGDEAQRAWQAADAGIARGFSIEFRAPNAAPRGAGVGRVNEATIMGAALTEQPVYSGARLTGVRSRTPRADSYREFLETVSNNETSGTAGGAAQ